MKIHSQCNVALPFRRLAQPLTMRLLNSCLTRADSTAKGSACHAFMDAAHNQASKAVFRAGLHQGQRSQCHWRAMRRDLWPCMWWSFQGPPAHCLHCSASNPSHIPQHLQFSISHKHPQVSPTSRHACRCHEHWQDGAVEGDGRGSRLRVEAAHLE